MDPTFPEIERYETRSGDTDLVGAHMATRQAEQRSVAVMATLAACAIAGAAIWAAGTRGPISGMTGLEIEYPATRSTPERPRG